VQAFVLAGERKALQLFARVVQAEHVGSGAHTDRMIASRSPQASSTCIAFALTWMPGNRPRETGACS